MLYCCRDVRVGGHEDEHAIEIFDPSVPKDGMKIVFILHVSFWGF
jgi:hypothetical protein